jgi:Rod binding domain-containing protein
MTIPPLPSSVDTSNIPVEDLAANKHLTQQQKIHEASRQFETIMLQQILSELQKPVIKSEFTDDSTAADIYQGYATNALAESMSKSGAFGFAKLFEEQLSPHPNKTTHHPAAATPETSTSSTRPLSTTHP